MSDQAPACPHCGVPLCRQSPDLLAIRDLSVFLPDGAVLFRNLDLRVQPGEVVVLLGGSGAGKSTLARVLFEPDSLREQGFKVDADRVVSAVPLGLVPQRGALFDHLDVAGNIELALRYAAPNGEDARSGVVEWLRRVDLDAGLAAPGTAVATLSGGQAQRLAVARTLAGGRKLLFLDEPSVGLDPARVRVLARQIRRQAENGTAFVVVTHDVALAAGVANRLLFLDSVSQDVRTLFDGEWPGPFDASARTGVDRTAWQARLEAELVRLLTSAPEGQPQAPRTKSAARSDGVFHRLVRPFHVPSAALVDGLGHMLMHGRDYLAILGRVLFQALVRPLPFYAIVSTLLGYTVLYVITRVIRDLSAQAAVQFIGSSHVVALVPPITAFLFVAASGNAVNAWLGGMSLTRQIAALEALGISRRTYLWSPAWMGLGLSCLAVSAIFGLGMVMGGWLYCTTDGVQNSWALLTSDFSDPRPERVPYLVRAAGLIFLYAWGIASDSVASGTADKTESGHVTRAMTGSVVRCTLWVVCLELLSAMILFAVQT